MTERVDKATELLDRYGWHRQTCDAYWSARASDENAPASEADDLDISCSCGFRDALGKAS